ncbi:MAG: S1 RNA-binding domain-containing protein [Oscillospiraceae bacterium]|jgi:S1 RNA binding domain protein|nr:S1 RNA-binding domain-containing protein [Oscillospiraceae bacterium]
MEYEINSIVTGKVTGIKKFGAFVDLPDGTRGLVRISEISRNFTRNVSDELSLGQTVKVKILSHDYNKTALSIRQADLNYQNLPINSSEKKLISNEIKSQNSKFEKIIKKFRRETKTMLPYYWRSVEHNKKKTKRFVFDNAKLGIL